MPGKVGEDDLRYLHNASDASAILVDLHCEHNRDIVMEKAQLHHLEFGAVAF